MEFQFQFQATPSTVTVRRNPRRKARDTPTTDAPDHPTPHPSSVIKPFPLQEILELDRVPPQIAPSLPKPSDADEKSSENLRVFLRIRPLDLKPTRSKPKSQFEKEKRRNITEKQNICLVANGSQSVVLTVPASVAESKRKKTEIYDGFSHVFSPDSPQGEVYERVMEPLVSDFIRGKSGLLAAMGPTGSGKTHTVFGCPRELGLVPLALRQIFDQSSGTGASKAPRSFYLSMFEICSERGKGERISDLSPDLADLIFQQSAIKGVKEAMVTDVTRAECFIACGLLKRATAATNANNQSSRSQCIINIRSAFAMCGNEAGFLQNDAVLTIVDLAGAERERRTGNQGARLLESSFINNTSMIFGLCLRSLLEHQKNPKKPLQKHFQNSLLTKYLRDYLEGKKRMTLILTAKPGEDDYMDTSYLLRHASPYMKIKFTTTEELSNMPCQKKRQIPTSNRANQLKRRKCIDLDAFVGFSEIDEVNCRKEVLQTVGKCSEEIAEQLQELEPRQDLVSPLLLVQTELQRMERKYQIMQDFSKAFWNVLKQYKKKLEISENKVQNLEESLKNEKVQFLDLQKQLNNLKSSCSCHIRRSKEAPSNSEVSSKNSSGVDAYSARKASEHNTSQKIYDTSVEQNLEISRLMENSDVVAVDSRFSMTEFKCENLELSSKNSSGVDAYSARKASVHNTSQKINDTSVEQNLEISRLLTKSLFSQMENSDVVVVDSKILMTEFKCENFEVSSKKNSGVDACSARKDFVHNTCHKIYDTSVDQNLEISQLKENSDMIVVDSKFSMTEFKCENGEQLLGSYESPAKDVGYNNGCHLSNVPSEEEKQDSTSKHSKREKPRRNSMLASTMLVEEDGGFDKEDDNAKQLLDSNESPAKDVGVSDRNHVSDALGGVKRHDSTSKYLNMEKPRRKLLPASTMLVKEFGGFDSEDDNPKNSKRAEKTASVGGRGQTRGGISLVQLLRNNLYL